MSGGGGASRKKFAKMSARPNGDMGAMGALTMLKTECSGIKAAGINWLVNSKQGVTPYLHAYLSGNSAKPHDDPNGGDWDNTNRQVYAAMRDSVEPVRQIDWKSTGTLPLQVDQEAALNVWCKIVDALKPGELADDGIPKFFLDTKGGAAKKAKPATSDKSGGFANLYKTINVPSDKQKKNDQDRCIFALTPAVFFDIGGGHSRNMMSYVKDELTKLLHRDVRLQVVHLLFHWNEHSFFKYHQDDDGDITVIINLSPGEPTMHVAGQVEATYKGIGSAHIFPSKVFHRSGDAPRRCIKIAAFYIVNASTVEIAEDDEDSGGAGSSSFVPGPSTRTQWEDALANAAAGETEDQDKTVPDDAADQNDDEEAAGEEDAPSLGAVSGSNESNYAASAATGPPAESTSF